MMTVNAEDAGLKRRRSHHRRLEAHRGQMERHQWDELGRYCLPHAEFVSHPLLFERMRVKAREELNMLWYSAVHLDIPHRYGLNLVLRQFGRCVVDASPEQLRIRRPSGRPLDRGLNVTISPRMHVLRTALGE